MQNTNPASIYAAPGTGRFYSPFNIALDSMERLMLINIDSDPDTRYTAFEPQVFDDPVNGTGLMVIAYLTNGKVDVYHQPGLTLDHKDFGIVGKGLQDLIEVPMPEACFEIQPNAVDVAIAFNDKTGRPIELRIQESGKKLRKPFALLAPLGSGTENPPSLPLVLLYGFYFVRRAGTRLVIKVDGKTHQPDSLPMPIDLSRVYFLRYAADPFPVTWNATHDGPLVPLEPGGAGQLKDGDAIYDLVENDNHYEIRCMSTANDRHRLDIRFDPPVPDVTGLKDGVHIQGRFVIQADHATGRITGTYAASRRSDAVTMTIHPAGGWQPQERKWSVNIMYRAVALFRNWPKKYVWNATIRPGNDTDGTGDTVTMQAKWSRTEAAKGFHD